MVAWIRRWFRREGIAPPRSELDIFHARWRRPEPGEAAPGGDPSDSDIYATVAVPHTMPRRRRPPARRRD